MKAQVYRHLNMPLAEAMHETNDWMAQSLTKTIFVKVCVPSSKNVRRSSAGEGVTLAILAVTETGGC